MSDPKDYNSELIENFRATREATGNPLDGRALLLLTTTGARTGLPRVTPLVAISTGGRLFIVASAGGSQFNPAWYHNLLANPEVTVEYGPDTFQAIASQVTDADRPALWAEVVRQFPFYAEYQAQVARKIPLLELTRKAS